MEYTFSQVLMESPSQYIIYGNKTNLNKFKKIEILTKITQKIPENYRKKIEINELILHNTTDIQGSKKTTMNNYIPTKWTT